MIHCIICSQTSQCFKCQIAQLKQENAELRKELTRLHSITNEQLQLKYWQQQEITNTFIQSKTKLQFEYKSKLSNAYFLTITFDPNKFGTEQLEDERKQYILYSLYKCIKSKMITELYGSFEYHKNGIIHSHAILITGFSDEIYQKLKPLYTDNSQNRIAIQIGKAKHPQAQQYIEKESTHYYYFNSHFSRSEEVPKVYESVPRSVASSTQSEANVSPPRDSNFTCLNPNDKIILEKYLKKKYLV